MYNPDEERECPCCGEVIDLVAVFDRYRYCEHCGFDLEDDDEESPDSN